MWVVISHARHARLGPLCGQRGGRPPPRRLVSDRRGVGERPRRRRGAAAAGTAAELALQLTDAIVAAKTAAERAGDRAFRAYGLSHRAQAALVAVDLGGPDGARPKEIATQLRVSRAAATTFIQRLETKGLVETTPDPEDDRGVRVTLTRRGLEVLWH